MKTSLTKRLGIPPIYPEPKPAVNPAAIAATQLPSAPVTQEQPTAPGMLPMTTAKPLYDATSDPVYSAEPQGATGWQGALQRALIGFSKGAGRVQVDPTYNPVAAGIVGGVGAIGAEQESSLNRKLALQAAQQKPFADAQAAALKKSYEDQAGVPFKQREEQATLNREIALQKDKYGRETNPDVIEPLAQHIATLPPSLRRVELGKQAGPVAMALAARVDAIRRSDPRMAAALDAERTATAGMTDAELEKRYQNELAGGKAGAAYDAGGAAQASARTANTVQGLLPDVRTASRNFARTDFPLANVPILAWDRATGGTDAMKFQQNFLEMRTKMALALQNGGATHEQAQKQIADIFPDSMTANQVESAADTINRIMENQKTGSLTPVRLNGGGAPVAAPSASGGSTWRKY